MYEGNANNIEIVSMISSYRSILARFFRLSINNRSTINNVINELNETEGS